MKTGKFAACTLMIAVMAASAAANSQSGTASGLRLRWRAGSLIRYSFNQAFAPGNNNELVRAAVGDALRSLAAAMPAGSSAVRFEDIGATSANRSDSDCVNMVSFTAPDPADQLPSGVIAAANTFFSDESGNFQCGSQVINLTPGEIFDADMLFNTSLRFSTSQQGSGIFDIQSIALHEGGHWLGLGHSGILAAAMSPFGESGEFPSRLLHSDDIASIRAIYGTAGIAGGAAASGRITTSGGAPIKSAHVVATSAATGLTAASAVSDSAGNFRIGGLAAGGYRVFAEPLDGPVRPGNFADYISAGANTDFVTTFFPATVNIAAADVAGINITASTPLTTNLDRMGISLAPGVSFSFGSAPKSVRRGTSPSIFLGGTNLSGQATFSSPGVTLRGMRQQDVNRIADVTISATAPLGPTDVYFGSTSLTGALVITVNPDLPSNGIVDAAAFNQGTSGPHHAPGSMISIFGRDLAEREAFADRVPLPTQLGGISVLIGDRLAPLYYVRGGENSQINAMIPFEVTGNSVPVQVLAGGQSESAAINVTIGTAAPRVFVVPNTQGNGAILNGSRANQLVTANTPAASGEVLVLFLTGLGRVRGNLATGLPSSGETTEATPSVTIGGRAASVQFSGLAPGFVGLYQVNVQVPAGLASGRHSVVVSSSGSNSNTAFVFVQ